MANVVNGNTLSVDSTGDVTSKATKVYYVTVTATSANCILVLSDIGASAKKIELRVAASGTTQLFDFSYNPIFFPNGVEATTVTNGVATLVL